MEIVKVYHQPRELQQKLEARDFSGLVGATPSFFLYGSLQRDYLIVLQVGATYGLSATYLTRRMIVRIQAVSVAHRYSLAARALFFFAAIFPLVYGASRPVAFTSSIFLVFICGNLLGRVGGFVAGVLAALVMVVWAQRLEPVVFLSLSPVTQVLVTISLDTGGVLVGWGRYSVAAVRHANAQLAEKDARFAQVNHELSRALQRRRADFDEARAIQDRLLPQRSPVTPSVAWDWLCEPCEEVGGDALGFTPLDGGRIVLYLLDVSGHGLPAALFSSALARLVPML